MKATSNDQAKTLICHKSMANGVGPTRCIAENCMAWETTSKAEPLAEEIDPSKVDQIPATSKIEGRCLLIPTAPEPVE